MRNLIRKSKSTTKSQWTILALKFSTTETKIQLSKVEFKTWRRGLGSRTVVSRKYPGSRAGRENREQEERHATWGSCRGSTASAEKWAGIGRRSLWGNHAEDFPKRVMEPLLLRTEKLRGPRAAQAPREPCPTHQSKTAEIWRQRNRRSSQRKSNGDLQRRNKNLESWHFHGSNGS